MRTRLDEIVVKCGCGAIASLRFMRPGVYGGHCPSCSSAIVEHDPNAEGYDG